MLHNVAGLFGGEVGPSTRQSLDLNSLVVFDSQLTYTFPWFMSTARRTILSTAFISFINSKRSMKRCNMRLRHGDL